MSKVLCFGELLMRLSPQLGGQWLDENHMPVFIGGAELNVATALALWGVPVRYCTAMPPHELTYEIVQHVSERGIDTSAIHYNGSRIGTYYLPHGGDLRSGGVIYDRDHSAFGNLQRGDIDWDAVLNDCDWLVLSAISPALGEALASLCLEAAEASAKRGIKVAIDLNYRPQLWQYDTAPNTAMAPLMQHCSLVMGNLWSAEALLRIDTGVPNGEPPGTEELVRLAGKSMAALVKTFPQVSTVGYTFRMQETYFGVLMQGSELAVSNLHPLPAIAERVGSGDCFMAGLLFGTIHNYPLQETVDFAASAAFIKMGIPGDATTATVADIKQNHHAYA